MQVQGRGDHGHIASPFQEGSRTPASPQAGSSGRLSRYLLLCLSPDDMHLAVWLAGHVSLQSRLGWL